VSTYPGAIKSQKERKQLYPQLLEPTFIKKDKPFLVADAYAEIT